MKEIIMNQAEVNEIEKRILKDHYRNNCFLEQ
jgi:hypothetical protein